VHTHSISSLQRQEKTSGRALPEVLEVYVGSMLKLSFCCLTLEAAGDLTVPV
jgi:hypothetical protein